MKRSFLEWEEHQATTPQQNKAIILRMNALLNNLTAREVGTNDGRFLPNPSARKP